MAACMALWLAAASTGGGADGGADVAVTAPDALGVATATAPDGASGRFYCPVRGLDGRSPRVLVLLPSAGAQAPAGDALDELVRTGLPERYRALVAAPAAGRGDAVHGLVGPLLRHLRAGGRPVVSLVSWGRPARATRDPLQSVLVFDPVGGPNAAALEGARAAALRLRWPVPPAGHAAWRQPWWPEAAEALLGPPGPTDARRNLRYYERPGRPLTSRTVTVDVCVYGGTAAGAVAAIQSARCGRPVMLVSDAARLGGLTTGGLSWTDIGNKGAIGGIAREFYRRLGARYGVAEEWCFEPAVAQSVLQEMVAEAGVPVQYRQFLKTVRREGRRIASITTEDGLTVAARVFIDATYEGDLMARAGVTFRVGREANAERGETLNGVQVRDKHQFMVPVDPYVREGDPASGLLPGIDPAPEEPQGTGDARVQAYNFRLCLTRRAGNRVPFARPRGYDRAAYALLERYLRHPQVRGEVFGKFDALRGEKVDKNNHGAFSTDLIGGNHAYPGAGYRERERLFQRHVEYQQGLFWFLCHDDAVPADVRERMGAWGLCADEYADTGGWSPQLYVREARRMVADYVLTEHDCRGAVRAPDPVGLGSYGMDSHNCRRLVRDGRVLNEGDVQVGGFQPYPVSYRAIVPRRGECANLLVPVCVSCTHISYGSVRMEPVFMILAQSAALAADAALSTGADVQDVPYAALGSALRREGQVLAWPP